MKARKSLSAIAASIALVVSSASFADSFWHEAGGERGYNEYPQHLKAGDGARVTTRASLENKVSADGLYRYANAETGWQLVQHSYAFRGGKIVHTDSFDHSAKLAINRADWKAISRERATGG